MNYLLVTTVFLFSMQQSALCMNKTYSAQATKKLEAAFDIPKERLNLKQLKEAIAEGADVNIKIHRTANHQQVIETPIALAAKFGDLEAAKSLIVAGASVNNACNGFVDLGVGLVKFTPLMMAIPNLFSDKMAPQIISMLQLLLDNGADINAQDIFGNTPLIHAIISGQPKIVAFLLEQGARTDLKTSSGVTAFGKKVSLYSNDRAKRMRAADADKEIQSILAHYKQRPEVTTAVIGQTAMPAGVAGIVTSYLYGKEPQQAAADAGAGAAGEVKKEVARAAVGAEVD